MSAAAARLDEYLRSTLDLKPPGITGSKVQYIARLCTSNIKEEPDLIQKIFDHFESAPATHKLGILYVIDFTVRCWIAHTRKFGRHPPNTAPDGTLAGGVDRITKLLPALMTGIVNHAPFNQKEKIEKLLEIWEEQKSFPTCMLDSFRKKVDALSSRAKSPPQPARVILTATNDSNGDQELADNDDARCTAQSLQLPRPSASFGNDIVDSNSSRWRHPGKYKGGKQPHYRQCRPDRHFSRIYQGSSSDKRKHSDDEPLVPGFSDKSSCSSSPQSQSHLAPRSQPKLVEWDYSICPGNIKVFSRTLFIKGDFSEELIRSHVEKFGAIQSCIIDKFKHHAFVMMISRKDAVIAHKGLYLSCSDKMQLQVKWGIGFGPHDCCDYENGISIIPIRRLTNADCTWLLTAEYGGTGDLPIQEGMAVEEPDIELGTGIASKVISRRIAAGPIGKNLKSGRVGRGGRRDRRRGRLTSRVKGQG